MAAACRVASAFVNPAILVLLALTSVQMDSVNVLIVAQGMDIVKMAIADV